MVSFQIKAWLCYTPFVSNSIPEQIIAAAGKDGRAALSEIESKQILQAIGIEVAIPEVARTADAAATAAARMEFPVALKVLSPSISHKSDVGGVQLGLASPESVRDAFALIRDNLAARAPQARFEGVAVQPMAAPGGVELIAGVTRDDRFGPMVMVGLGGVHVEVLKDTTLRLAPLSSADARAMVAELRGAALLRGVRGRPAADVDAIAELLVRLSDFAVAHPEVQEMDLNPISAYPRGVAVLDARVLVGPPKPLWAANRTVSSRHRR